MWSGVTFTLTSASPPSTAKAKGFSATRSVSELFILSDSSTMRPSVPFAPAAGICFLSSMINPFDSSLNQRLSYLVNAKKFAFLSHYSRILFILLPPLLEDDTFPVGRLPARLKISVKKWSTESACGSLWRARGDGRTQPRRLTQNPV
jgi:hypothetical protein